MKIDILGMIKKQWLLVWCAVTAMSLIAIVASAEYDDIKSTMKRVVRATSDQGKMFSSNVLIENGDASYVLYYKQANEAYDVDIYLWNYSMTNISKWYAKDIEYTMTLTFTNSSGEPLADDELNGKTVLLTEDDSTIVSLDRTAPATSGMQILSHSPLQSAEHHYILKFPVGWDLEHDTDICVKVEAVPDNGATRYPDLSPVSAVIGLRQSNGGSTSGWEAYLAEQRAGITIADCDAYNIVATGSGKATVTIKWDNRYLECNKYML